MNLKKIEILKKHRGDKYLLTISRKGTIRLSVSLARKLNLKENDELAFYIDSDSPDDAYFKIEKGIRLRNAGKSLIGNSVSVSESIMNICKEVCTSNESISILVSIEAISDCYYPIITKSAKTCRNI